MNPKREAEKKTVLEQQVIVYFWFSFWEASFGFFDPPFFYSTRFTGSYGVSFGLAFCNCLSRPVKSGRVL